MTDTLVFGNPTQPWGDIYSGYNLSFRMVIPAAALLNVTKDEISVDIYEGYGTFKASIGIRSGSTGYACVPGSIVPLTFNGGNTTWSGVNPNYPLAIRSDSVPFPYTGTDDLIVTVYCIGPSATPPDIEGRVYFGGNYGSGAATARSTGDQTNNNGGTWAGLSENILVRDIYVRSSADLTSTRASQAQVIAVEGDIAPAMRMTQAGVIAIYSVPAEWQHVSQAQVTGVVTADLKMRLTQAQVIAVVKGRREDRRVRAWTFTLDGHDFYVLRAGEEATLVYDMTTKQWCQWSSLGLPYWRAHIGMNWGGMSATSIDEGATSTGVAGDDQLGLLWTVKPEQGYDENPDPVGNPTLFVRRVTGGYPMRLRTAETCSAVFLTAALDSAQFGLSATDITLRTSDDNGRTYVDHGTVTVSAGQYDQEISWRSLGLIRAPGRIFEISDTGATVRIDGLDMRTTDGGDLPEG